MFERVAAGELKRVMIFAPPRHGKSLITSTLFSAYCVYRFPEKFVAIASYAQPLADSLSRQARTNYMQAIGSEIDSETMAVRHWETGKGGGMIAVGVGAGITGKGFGSVGIIDDSVKDEKAAKSVLVRDGIRDWYRSVWLTRAEPDAALVTMQTRWAEDDLPGWLLEEESGDNPENWHIVSFPAISESEPQEIPANCTLEPDFRKPGEALCPERFSAERLKKLESRAGAYVWNALYQQRPKPLEGNMFKWQYFEGKYLDATPSDITTWIAYFDTAGTEGAGDETAGTLMGLRRDGSLHIEENVGGQWGIERKDVEIAATCERWRTIAPSMTVWLEHEAGIGGKDRTAATIRALRGFRVYAERAVDSKELRAEPFAAQCQAGNVTIRRGPWNHAFLTQATAFPHGKRDDRVDSASGAFTKLAGARTLGFR